MVPRTLSCPTQTCWQSWRMARGWRSQRILWWNVRLRRVDKGCFMIMKIWACCEKTGILHTRKQRRRSVTAKLISAFVFNTQIVQSLYFLNPKFQASSHLMSLYSLVCVGPGRKPRRAVFSKRGSYYFAYFSIYTKVIGTCYQMCSLEDLYF